MGLMQAQDRPSADQGLEPVLAVLGVDPSGLMAAGALAGMVPAGPLVPDRVVDAALEAEPEDDWPPRRRRRRRQARSC